MTEPISSLRGRFRADIPGRFNELDLLRRQWSLFAATTRGQILPPYEVLIHPSSGCNLRCAWCIGDHVPVEIWDEEQERLRFLDAAKEAPERLPDTLADPAVMMKLARDIAAYRKTATFRSGGIERTAEFRVHNVSFSGLIGEPLVARAALLPAMGHLVEAGIRVGLFTNGVLMNEAVVDVLLRTAYVHLSLDAGTAETYALLKFKGHRSGMTKFDAALANLARLAARRRVTGSELEINVSFILYPENHHEVYEAARIAREAGADRLRLKRDISGDRLLDVASREAAKALVERIRRDLVDEDFQLVEVHKAGEPDDLARTFTKCSITNMMAAVGSDGHLYPCNYHPRPGGASYGSAVDTGFEEVWEGARRMDLRRKLPSICPKVCDPFKNRANNLLQSADRIIEAHGLDHLERDVHALVETDAYDLRHGRRGD